jgi:hypothetical protein
MLRRLGCAETRNVSDETKGDGSSQHTEPDRAVVHSPGGGLAQIHFTLNPGVCFCAVVVLALILSGCKRSPSSRYGGGEPIKGSRSDPPVSLRAGWGATNRYFFHLISITASDEPRRNTSDLVTREINFGQDFSLTVTNALPDGSRVLEMDIQGVQFDTTVGDKVTVNFDSGHENLDLTSAPLVGRLQKIIGSRVAFYLTPENKVRRIEGLKEINDRLMDRAAQTNSSTRNAVRGLTSVVLNRFFSTQFWRDILEMSALPTNEVRVGETWTVTRDTTAGSTGARMTAELTYSFTGWQQHDDRKCARLEFSGTLKPGAPPRQMLRNLTNFALGRPPPGNPPPGGSSSGTPPQGNPPPNAPAPMASPPGEAGTIHGVTWFSPELGLPVEMVMDQSVVLKSVQSRRVRISRGTNAPLDTNAPAVAFTNMPPETITSTSRQHVNLKLVDVTPIAAAGGK